MLCRETQDALEVPAWHKEVLDQRIVRIANGKETTSLWEEAKKRIREQADAADALAHRVPSAFPSPSPTTSKAII